MLKTYTEAEILQYWKRRLGLAAADAPSPSSDLTELDARLLGDIQSWYANLLATAPPQCVPLANLAAEAEILSAADGMATLRLPDRGVRPVQLRMEGWDAPVRTFVGPHSDVARLQRYRWTRATPADPAAILLPGRLEVYGLPDATPCVAELLMTAYPDDGYVLDPALLSRSTLLIS